MGVKKKFGLGLLFLVFLAVAASRFGDLPRFIAVVTHANLFLLGAAVLFHFFSFGASASSLRVALRIVDEQLSFPFLLKTALLMDLVRISVPSGGLSGNVFLVKKFVDKDIPTGTATIAVVLSGFSFYVAFFSMLAFGVTYLALLEKLSLMHSFAAAGFALLMFAALYYVLFTTRDRDRLQRHAHWLRDLFTRLKYIPPADVTVFANDLYRGREMAEEGGFQIVVLIFFKFLAHLFDAVALFVVALAFDTPVTFVAVLVAYAVASTFTKFLLVPAGIGTYETLMVLVFTAFAVPFEHALAVTLTFRVILFWLPMLFTPFLVKEVT